MSELTQDVLILLTKCTQTKIQYTARISNNIHMLEMQIENIHTIKKTNAHDLIYAY